MKVIGAYNPAPNTADSFLRGESVTVPPSGKALAAAPYIVRNIVLMKFIDAQSVLLRYGVSSIDDTDFRPREGL